MVGQTLVCPVNANSKLTFQFRESPDNPQPGQTIDPSHKGPCSVYMKHVDSAMLDVGTGDGWFKIWGEGYDSATAQWCTEKLIQNKGFLSISIPRNLAGGYYLVRPELISLQKADKTPPIPQFYVGCAQIFLGSHAKTLPKQTVKIPGYVSMADPGVTFNIYSPKFPYMVPGPDPYVDQVSPSVQFKGNTSAFESVFPPNAVLKSGNWLGIELDDYSTEEGCWNASISSPSQVSN